MKFLKASLFLLCSLFIATAGAEQVKGLYEVIVPVQSQSSADLRKASSSGLATVFIRVSGRADSISNPAIKSELGNARSYLKQYSYRHERDPVDDTGQLLLVLEFEAGLVDRQLRAAGLPMWSPNRPSILLWLVVDDSEGRRIVGAETSPQGVAVIQSQATRRGLPVNLPLLDLEDNVAISADALWGFNRVEIERASARYQPDTQLVGRASQLSSGRWLGAWRFMYEGQLVEFETEAAGLDGFVAQATDQVAELLSRQYAIIPVRIVEDGILMRITGIRNFSDYAGAVRYLEGLAAIRSANVVVVNGDTIVLRLFAEGQMEQLQQAISRDAVLLPVTIAELNEDEDDVSMTYQWPESNEPN